LKQTKFNKERMTTVIKETVGNGVSHLKAIGDEIVRMNVKDMDAYKELGVEDQAHFQKLQFLQHIINDIIHPLHEISLELFKEDKALFTDLIKRNQSARSSKLLPPCFCSSCSQSNVDNSIVGVEKDVVEKISDCSI